MRIGKPTPLEAEYLAKMGLAGLCNFDLADTDFARHLEILRRQHGIKRHGVQHHDEFTLRARALARAAHDSYGRKKLEEQAPHPYVLQMNRRLNIAIVCIIVAIVGMMIFAVKGHAQTAKGNAGPAARANIWYWNGSAYVPVENASPLPVAIVSGGGSGGTASSFGATFPAVGTAIGVKNSGNMSWLTSDASDNLNVNCQTGCAGAAGGISSTATLGALNAAVSIALDKYTGSGFTLTSGALTGTITPQVSFDGGTNWKNTYFIDLSKSTGNIISGAVNPSSTLGYSIFLPTGVTNAQVKVTAYTSGSVSATIRAMTANAFPAEITVDWATGDLNFAWIDADNGGARTKLFDGGGANRAAFVNAANELLTSTAVLKWAGGTLGAMNTYGTTPGAVLVPGVNAFVTNIPAVTQSGGPWTVDHTKTAGQTLGAITNYGTSPGAVLVEGTNAFVTNNVAVTLSAETTKVIGTVNQGTNPWVVSVPTWAGGTLGAMANYGTSPGAVLVPGMNAFITNIPAVSQSGNWVARIVGNAGGVLDAVGQNAVFPANWLAAGCEFTTAPTTLTTGKGSPLSCDTGNNLFVNVASSVLPTGAATSTKQSDGTQKTQIVDGSGNVIASTSNNLNVQCANCSGSGASAVDKAAFTASSSVFAPAGGFFQTTATNNPLTDGQQGMAQMTATRAMFMNLRNASGTEVGTAGTPLQVSLANTGSNATAVAVSGTFFQSLQPVSCTAANCKVEITGNAGASLDAAFGAAAAANGMQPAMLAITALPTAVANAQDVQQAADKFGRTVTVPITIRDLNKPAVLQTTSATPAALLAAQGVGVFADLIDLLITSESATACLVTLSDGTNSYKINVANTQGSGTMIAPSTPWPAASSNTAWNATGCASVTLDYDAHFALNK